MVQIRVSICTPSFISLNITIDHTAQAFHLRPCTERKRLFATQFGIGRQEELQNVDFFFYRYQLCKQQGWDYFTSAFANMILLEPEAPYVLRVALVENDPTAAACREKIEAWNREVDPEWAKYQPLRWALSRQLLDGSMDGWEELQSHPIFGIRAKFEPIAKSVGAS
jgi:hypothetical protein